MNPRIAVALLSAALIAYFFLIAGRAAILFRAGTVVTVGLGVAALLLPVVGAILLFLELRFGWRTQRLGSRLGAEDGLPKTPDLPVRPSGRIDKAAALPHFEAIRAEVEANPADWRGWFKLADAYDLAGDRRRARAAMRKAIEFEAGPR